MVSSRNSTMRWGTEGHGFIITVNIPTICCTCKMGLRMQWEPFRVSPGRQKQWILFFSRTAFTISSRMADLIIFTVHGTTYNHCNVKSSCKSLSRNEQHTMHCLTLNTICTVATVISMQILTKRERLLYMEVMETKLQSRQLCQQGPRYQQSLQYL